MNKVDLKRAALTKSFRQKIKFPVASPVRDRIRAAALRLTQEYIQKSPPYEHPAFSVWNQLIRSINSVGANLSEGSARTDGPDVLRFLKIARGSLVESVFHAECLSLSISEYSNMVADLDELILSTIDSADLPEF